MNKIESKGNYYVPSNNRSVKVYLKNNVLDFGNNITWKKTSDLTLKIPNLAGKWIHSGGWKINIKKDEFNPFIYDIEYQNGINHKIYVTDQFIYADISPDNKGFFEGSNTKINWSDNTFWKKTERFNNSKLEHFNNSEQCLSNKYVIILLIIGFIIYYKNL